MNNTINENKNLDSNPVEEVSEKERTKFDDEVNFLHTMVTPLFKEIDETADPAIAFYQYNDRPDDYYLVYVVICEHSRFFLEIRDNRWIFGVNTDIPIKAKFNNLFNTGRRGNFINNDFWEVDFKDYNQSKTSFSGIVYNKYVMYNVLHVLRVELENILIAIKAYEELKERENRQNLHNYVVEKLNTPQLEYLTDHLILSEPFSASAWLKIHKRKPNYYLNYRLIKETTRFIAYRLFKVLGIEGDWEYVANKTKAVTIINNSLLYKMETKEELGFDIFLHKCRDAWIVILDSEKEIEVNTLNCNIAWYDFTESFLKHLISLTPTKHQVINIFSVKDDIAIYGLFLEMNTWKLS